MVEPGLPNKQPTRVVPTVPQKGGPRHRPSAVAQAAREESQSPDPDHDPAADGQEPSSGTGTLGILDMANPDRPYNMWGDGDDLFLAYGALIPEGYKHDETVAGLIIQVVGEQNPVPCSACRRHGDCPFDSCVSLSAEVAEEVSGLLVSSTRACANCLTRKVSSACSLKSRGLAQRNPPKGDPYLGEELLGHRRPARLSRTSSHDDAYGEDEVRFEEVIDKLRQRRFATLRPSKRLHNGHTPMPRESRVTSDIWNGTPPTEADLRMEGWEMEDGRINTTGESLAFSSAYLSANQTVQISTDVSLQTVAIPSGCVHQFAADENRIRICTLAGGKLRVRVGGAAAPEFAIGSQGIFKILPGVACSVTNRCYVDAVLHVTSLPPY
ncbi:721d872f-1a2c-4cca-8963-e77c8beff363 [Thermothielavioides terrestris]|uniref:721d872f-1a2c-4cca-8963-e77c8beff363 n=1 Tax=Thermothielavioides terrestris TaxID=2587410 RepID=A0A446BLN1_9PEZI|nr:721d872f-1a2c-4cca-8963-e77c8beff363 [Thermothielavioides terrestris]